MLNPPRLALVTGATGFVGAAVARVLIKQGVALRLLVRANSNPRNIDDLPCERVVGDLANPASLAPALAGCDALFHVAADYRLWVPDAGPMYAANVDGTVNLLRAAKAAGVARIVYTSSVATLGHHGDDTPADESTPSTIDDMIGHYKRSKFMAEAAVRDMAKTEKLPVVIVNPAAPIGPRDVKPTPTGAMIVAAMHGQMPAYLNTGLNVVHVDDCAEGHWLAYQRGVVGERYILGGENLLLRDILQLVAAGTKQKAPTVELRREWLWPVAYGMECVARFSNYQPMLTTDTLRMAAHKMFFTSRKAQQQLGYAPRPAAQAIADAIAWFRANNY